MAIRLADRLLSSGVMDYIALNDDITITELKVTTKLAGQTVQQASIRNKYQLNIIALQHGNITITEITPNLELKENDIVVLVGNKENIRKFESFLMGGH